MSVQLGQIIHYRLSPTDAETVNHTRTSHVGNSAYPGEVVPLLVTRVDPRIDAKFENDPAARPETISGQAFLDGNFHHLWIQRVTEGEEHGTWTGSWSGPEPVAVAEAPVEEVAGDLRDYSSAQYSSPLQNAPYLEPLLSNPPASNPPVGNPVDALNPAQTAPFLSRKPAV